jgi:DNA polymerase-3 subunit gamma/tau
MASEYQSLYRKYRPTTFSEIIGQRHVTQTLANALKTGRMSHAYLFCGPRGTGKTTTARVLAMALNCEKGPTAEPCGSCDACLEIKRGSSLDVIEFDAASHRGVEDIGELRRRFQFSPGQTRFKVYIIDEVHQLSDQAFDMFLKVLEEPPSQVVFVLATTEAHKVKPTILSRCQRFDFHRISSKEIEQRLRLVCEQEGLQAEDAALSLLAHAAEGAARDGLSLLEQASAFSGEKITAAEARVILGGIEPELLIEFGGILAHRRVEEAFALIERVVAEGKDLVQLVKELTQHLRDLLMIKVSDRGRRDDLSQIEIALPPEYLPRLQRQAGEFAQTDLLEIIGLLCQTEAELRFSDQQRLLLELFAARACGLSAAEEAPAAKPTAAAAAAASTERDIPPAPRQAPVSRETEEKPKPAVSTPEEIKERWPEVLEALKKEKQVAIRTLVQDAAVAELKENVLVLTFSSEFNHAEISKQEKKALLEQTLEKVLGRPLRVQCKLHSAPGQPAPKETDSLLSEALDMFPGSEVL